MASFNAKEVWHYLASSPMINCWLTLVISIMMVEILTVLHHKLNLIFHVPWHPSMLKFKLYLSMLLTEYKILTDDQLVDNTGNFRLWSWKFKPCSSWTEFEIPYSMTFVLYLSRHLTIYNILVKNQPRGNNGTLISFMTVGIDLCPSWNEFLQNFL